MVNRGSLDERLTFIFNMYDADGSGFLEKEEIFEIFKSSLQSRGEYATDATLQQWTEEALRAADANGDGKLSFTEFKSALESQAIFINAFPRFPIL